MHADRNLCHLRVGLSAGEVSQRSHRRLDGLVFVLAGRLHDGPNSVSKQSLIMRASHAGDDVRVQRVEQVYQFLQKKERHKRSGCEAIKNFDASRINRYRESNKLTHCFFEILYSTGLQSVMNKLVIHRITKSAEYSPLAWL